VNHNQLRRVHNEATIQEGTNRVRAQAIERILGMGAKADNVMISVQCECSSLDCKAVISLPLVHYQSILAEDGAYAVLLGHNQSDIEDVRHTFDDFLVVSKHEQNA
jgi:hypothetical protein